MAIPALATADKGFICSYVIGSSIDHRKALGIINEIITFTNEYIDGFCRIPVVATLETNEHSYYNDAPAKNQVYVKVGVRVSADGYLHAWLLSTQKVAELILWNNRYNTTNNPIPNSTVLHWAIEKMYRLAIGNTTNFVANDIKFQKYGFTGATRLSLFGNYSNSLTNSVKYTIDPANVIESDFSWYPNNSTSTLGDYLFAADELYSLTCQIVLTGIVGDWWQFTGAFGKSPDTTEPAFYTIDSTPGNESIPAICDPATITSKTFTLCNRWISNGIGNNSGRSYTVTQTGVECMGCTGQYSWSTALINLTPNVAYIWVPGACSDPAYGNQTDCENAGETWTPGHYACDPSFVYDSSISFTYGKFNSKAASQIFYLGGDAQFVGLNHATNVFAKYYKMVNILDSFNVLIDGDLDELKVGSYVDAIITPDPPGGNEGCALRTLFTKHVGIALLTNDTDVTRDNADWTVVWQIPVHSTDDTTNGVTSDDATDQTTVNTLLNEIKGDYNTHRVSTTFHELADNTNVVSSADSTSEATAVTLANEIKADYNAHRGQAGVHYDDDAGNTVTSANATDLTTAIILANEIKLDYNSHLDTTNGYTYFSDWKAPDGLALRTPGTPNTPYTRPITHHDEFKVVANEPCLGGFLYDLVTSNAFLERDPGTETKIVIPISNLTDFDFLYDLVTSNAFLERDPGSETKIEYPIGNNADFCFLYKFEEFILAKLYHLQTTGDDLDDGLSWATAWATWTHAMQTTPSERTLLVEEGNYAGETQVEPSNSIVIFLVKNEIDAVSTVVVTLA